MKAGLYTYAWDLEDWGYDRAVAEIAEAGFTAINLATAYHAGKFILPRNPKRRVYFSEDGSIYFNPDLSRYGRIQPRVNSLVCAGSDPVSKLTAETRARGLEYVAWTVLTHNTWLGTAYPDTATVNAFGDPQLHTLSPAHPDVREYLVAMIADFARKTDVAAIELESPGYMGFAHGFHHEIFGVEPDAATAQLLALSFHEVEIAGATAAGIDAARLKRRVAEAIDGIWNRGADPATAEALCADAELTAYREWLTDRTVTLCDEIRAAVQEVNSSVRIRHFAAMGAGETANLDDPMLGSADEILTGYAATVGAVGARAAAFAASDKPVWGMLRAISPDFPTPDGLAEVVDAWQASGVAGIDVYNFGLMSQPNWDALAAALRG
jgi:hypothetical protein